MSSFGHRPSVEELLAAYEIDQGLVNPRPRWIGVFDDVLTAGTHFSSDEEHTAAQLSRGSSLRFSSRAASSLTRLISAVVTLDLGSLAIVARTGGHVYRLPPWQTGRRGCVATPDSRVSRRSH